MILDNYLNEIGKAMSGQSFVIPAYMTADTLLSTETGTDTVLPGEKGTRYAVSIARDNNNVTYSGIRSGTQVTTSTGDNITAFALLSASASGTLFTENVVGTLNQSTGFDIETVLTVGLFRR